MLRVYFHVLLAVAASASVCSACSRVLWASNGRLVLAGRNLDWIDAMTVDLYALPRGRVNDAQTGPMALKWTAKYGSLVAGSPAGVVDGFNEKGLAGHMLWLSSADFGIHDPARPSLGVGHWLQYQLDNFATVSEAVTHVSEKPYQVLPGVFDGLKTSVHLALEDASGDSAIIEVLGGSARIHHGREFTVMTNDPPFDRQLANLKQCKAFGGSKALPGTTDAADRFVRAASYLAELPKPATDREAVGEIFSVIRGVSQPFAPVDPEKLRTGQPHTSPTRWRTVIDLTRRIYFYESTMSPNVIWVRMEALDFAPDAGVRRLEVNGPADLVGECSGGFKPSKPFGVLRPELR